VLGNNLLPGFLANLLPVKQKPTKHAWMLQLGTSIRDERKVHEMLPPPKSATRHWCCRPCCGAGRMDGVAAVLCLQDDRQRTGLWDV